MAPHLHIWNPPGLKHRVGAETLIPYVPFPLPKAHGALATTEVVVGPTDDEPRAMQAASSLLMSQNPAGLWNGSIRTSEIPYRTT